MAFAYTVTADKQTHITGHMCFARGTWTAGNVANGTIVTGLSEVILANVWNNEAVSEAPIWEINETGAGAAQNGSIGITGFADQVNNTGHWWAIGYV